MQHTVINEQYALLLKVKYSNAIHILQKGLPIILYEVKITRSAFEKFVG